MTVGTRTAAEYAEQLEQMAREAYASHEGATKAHAKSIGISGAALHWDGGRVYIKRVGTNFYATEFVWLRFGRMLIHGDIAPVIVAVSSASFREAVHQFATGTYIDYFAGKVNQGEVSMDSAYTCDADAFAAELSEELAEARAGFEARGGRGVEDADHVDALTEAHRIVTLDGDLDLAKRELNEAGFDEVHNYGRVIAPRVFYAHAALKRLDAISGWRCPACPDVAGMTGNVDGTCGAYRTCDACNGTGTIDERPARGAA